MHLNDGELSMLIITPQPPFRLASGTFFLKENARCGTLLLWDTVQLSRRSIRGKGRTRPKSSSWIV